jgi:hypothetical protein
LDAQGLKKVNHLLDWAGSEGTAGWFAIFTHFRKLSTSPFFKVFQKFTPIEEKRLFGNSLSSEHIKIK